MNWRWYKVLYFFFQNVILLTTDKAVLIPHLNFLEMSTSEMLIHLSNSTLDEFYPAIAIATLMRIIRDNTLAHHHPSVVQAVTFVFKSLNISCVQYIPQVIPSLIQVIRTTEMVYKDFLFQQLGMLVAIVKQHIRTYLADIFKLIKVTIQFCMSMSYRVQNFKSYVMLCIGILDDQPIPASDYYTCA